MKKLLIVLSTLVLFLYFSTKGMACSIAGDPPEFQIKNDFDTKLFKNINLKFIDLSECSIESIPFLEFATQSSLEHLNLSGNSLTIVELNMSLATNLSLFNISWNNIETMSNFMWRQLELIGRSNGKLVVDLSGNPLSCLCNTSIEFLSWMQTTSNVYFEGLNMYRCLHPNGSEISIRDIETKSLESTCDLLKTTITNNSQCPCDMKVLDRLQDVRLSLGDYFCRDSASNLVQLTSLTSNCRSVLLSATFIAPVACGVLLIVVVLCLSVVSYKRRKNGKRPLIDCSQLNWNTGVYLALQFLHHRAEERASFPIDLFVCYHDDFRRQYLFRFLPRLSADIVEISSRDDFELGSPLVESTLQYIKECRVIVLILSPSFVADDWCRYFVISAMSRPHAIVPVVYEEFHEESSSIVFSNLMQNNRPFYWSTENVDEEVLFQQLITRIKHNVVGEHYEGNN